MIGRRAFVHGAAAVGMTRLLGVPSAAAEPPPETATLRIGDSPSLCAAPQFVAEDLLRSEGFTSVKYIKSADMGAAQWRDLATGKSTSARRSAALLLRIDAQDPIVLLAGIHVGCFELFGTPRIRASGTSRARPLRSGRFTGADPVLVSGDGGPRRPRSPEGHRVGHPYPGRGQAPPGGGEGGCLHRLSPDPQELRANGDRPRRRE